MAAAVVPLMMNIGNGLRAGERDADKQLVEDECTQCHEFDRVARQHLSKEEWRGVIKGMVDEGPPLTPGQFGAVLDYLARHYGPEKSKSDGRDTKEKSQ